MRPATLARYGANPFPPRPAATAAIAAGRRCMRHNADELSRIAQTFRHQANVALLHKSPTPPSTGISPQAPA